VAARLLPWREDPTQPTEPVPLTISVDGLPVTGLVGQSLAGVLLASGTVGFRRTSQEARPRGVFCGIGVCYDCLVDVNGLRDVRACQRRAADGDVVVTQHDPLPAPAEFQP
jgi:D-hydroxyproline dehydrogenase subunit gamma